MRFGFLPTIRMLRLYVCPASVFRVPNLVNRVLLPVLVTELGCKLLLTEMLTLQVVRTL